MKRNVLLILTLATLLFTGCLPGSPGGGSAEVGLYLTDSGDDASSSQLGIASLDEEIAEIWVTVEAVTGRVNKESVKLFDVPEGEGRVNLKDLYLAKELLGNSRIPAGNYDEIRFELSKAEQDNYIVFADGQEIPLNIPSNELKPKFNITIFADTVTELVFDVNPDFLVERGESGSYNINPRKGLTFVGAFDDIYGSLTGEIELPEGIDNLLSIQIDLFSTDSSDARPEPIWTTTLEDDKITFAIATLPEGEYWLEATVTLFDLATLTLDTDPFWIDAGINLDVALQK